MSPVRVSHVIAGLFLGLVAAGCGFDSSYDGTRYRCGADNSCPSGFSCSAGVCALVGGPDAATAVTAWSLDTAEDFTANAGEQTGVEIQARGSVVPTGASGVYSTAPHDLGTPIDFERIRWVAQTPQGTGVVIRLRTCDVATACASQEWSSPLISPSGSEGPFPPKRFVQWRAELSASAGNTPSLDFVSIETTGAI